MPADYPETQDIPVPPTVEDYPTTSPPPPDSDYQYTPPSFDDININNFPIPEPAFDYPTDYPTETYYDSGILPALGASILNIVRSLGINILSLVF